MDGICGWPPHSLALRWRCAGWPHSSRRRCHAVLVLPTDHSPSSCQLVLVQLLRVHRWVKLNWGWVVASRKLHVGPGWITVSPCRGLTHPHPPAAHPHCPAKGPVWKAMRLCGDRIGGKAGVCAARDAVAGFGVGGHPSERVPVSSVHGSALYSRRSSVIAHDVCRFHATKVAHDRTNNRSTRAVRSNRRSNPLDPMPL